MAAPSAVAAPGKTSALRLSATAAALGILAMVFADLVHEALGHGVACLLSGNRILSLSTVAIQTAAPSLFVSAAGTCANLLIGSFSLLAFARLRQLTPRALLVWLFGIFNLFNAGYLTVSAVTAGGDWANVIAGLSPSWLWRCFLALAGTCLYVAALRWATGLMLRRVEGGQLGISGLSRLTLTAYLAAGVIMTTASLFNPIGPRLIFSSGVGASFGLNAGLLFIPKIVSGHVRTHPPVSSPLRPSLSWVALALVAGGFFVAVLGPGVQFPAPAGLLP